MADLLSRMNFMERRGSGFRKIINAVKTAPNFKDETLPAFRSTPFIFTIEIKNMNDGFNGEIINDTINDTINGTINSTINGTINASDGIVDGDDTINGTINDTINDTINVRINASDGIVGCDDRINVSINDEDRINGTINGTINASDGIVGDDDKINGTIKLTNTDVYIFVEIQMCPNATIPFLVEKTGLSRRTIIRSIKILKDNGYITRVGAKKKGYWQVNDLEKK